MLSKMSYLPALSDNFVSIFVPIDCFSRFRFGFSLFSVFLLWLKLTIKFTSMYTAVQLILITITWNQLTTKLCTHYLNFKVEQKKISRLLYHLFGKFIVCSFDFSLFCLFVEFVSIFNYLWSFFQNIKHWILAILF